MSSAAPHRLGRAIWAVMGTVASVVLFAMMALTFADVVARYLFNAPLPGSFELTELMMVLLIFAGLPLVSRNDKHVTIDLIDNFVSVRARRALTGVAHFLVALVLLYLAWLVWGRAERVASYGDMTTVLQIQLGPFVYLMAALIFATALVHLAKAFRPPAEHGPAATL